MGIKKPLPHSSKTALSFVSDHDIIDKLKTIVLKKNPTQCPYTMIIGKVAKDKASPTKIQLNHFASVPFFLK